MKLFLFSIGFGIAFSATALPAPAAPKPLLQSGDRIAFVGNTLIERARLYGHIESALQLAAGESVENLVFRNLGWSADSVFGDSRSYFGPPQEGRDRLDKNISEVKPNVVFLCYGTGEAMSVDAMKVLSATIQSRHDAIGYQDFASWIESHR